ncbi:alkaline phosphatase [Actinoalloteichus hoggarensis]|uniref:Alkaline phosphatase 3 n=1 Tax=Actinoalloteichus hoggarensis TaxID=1470176 RepID=A0A221W3V1_9PSEU|nr:alkaline phosphatase [Actinoalloteichus hoggarensis]ASO20353.1 Alkaline phosphatase 3 precursor [Actinoalloteichus hoggarensis]MBB5923391.1 alkaline phosphatase [Actinoalloteichus hoggarensis]
MTNRVFRRLPALAAAGVLMTGLTLSVAGPAAAQVDGPKNIILLIGDGMGYNHVDAASLYEHGTSNHQVVVDPATGSVEHLPGTASQVFESFPVQVAMSTHSANGRAEYDPVAAWSDFDWVASGATDSAAAGTALATGVKTNNGTVGLAPDGSVVTNVAERAAEIGKATGVVTSVMFSDATPAAWGAHSADRGDLHAISDQMIDSSLDVIVGAGHPLYGDDNELLDEPRHLYLSAASWDRLRDGETAFELIEDKADFEAVASGERLPEKYLGLTQVAFTLQQARSGDVDGVLPFEVPANDVPDLPTLTQGALNVLSQNEDGLFLMVEGGAIDWAGHANQIARDIEETVDFNRTVETVVDWVETESSWDETLVIVTADHETGYLDGSRSNPTWTPITGEQGQLPDQKWFSIDHTNQLVPLFAKGAGSEVLAASATGVDPVRGAYLDNVDVAGTMFGFWGGRPEGVGTPRPAVVPGLTRSETSMFGG